MAYTSSQIVQAVPTGINSALVLISTTTIGTTVASVTVTNCFNASYDSYKIIASGVTASGSGSVAFQLTGLTTGYFGQGIFTSFTATGPFLSGYNNIASVTHGGGTDSSFLCLDIDIDSPFLAKPTFIFCRYIDNTNGGTATAKQTSSTSATGFTITPASGTLTGGTIRVYGYTNS
jgi:hypothetical protein